MFWFPGKKFIVTWIIRFCICILKSGQVPKHVAIIMDGNRRFARKIGMETTKGHEVGSNKLEEVFSWCPDFGIKELTIYAFSIENFKRTAMEVESLMDLMKRVSKRILHRQKTDPLYKAPCCQLLGNLKLLPQDVQEALRRLQEGTKNNNGLKLNICISYTSRDEISSAIGILAEGVSLGLIEESDITEDLMSKCMYTRNSRDPDLIIRTSGELRLSDFLLWQSTYSCLCFLDVLWPQFSEWHMCFAILWYQRNISALKSFRNILDLRLSADGSGENNSSDWRHPMYGKSTTDSDKVDQFLQYVEMKRTKC